MDATLLIQDVQLLCFTIVFGVMAVQRWSDSTRRWLWYTFLANAVGAIFDLTGSHLPNWIEHGINVETIPLSYAILNVACAQFVKRGKRAIWFSFAILVVTLPIFLAWCNRPIQFPSLALGDLVIALEAILAAVILLPSEERSTRAPRWVLGSFLAIFAIPETTRFVVAFALHSNPDLYSQKLEFVSAVSYVVTTSVLPLAFIWMMNARLEAELLHEAIVDPLTQVLNRRGLEQALDRELARLHRYGGDLTVAILDLDHFKQLNDAHGHVAGDAVLTTVAELLGKRLRITDVVGRFGGEEFVLLLPYADQAKSGPVLEFLCQALREHPFTFANTTVHATASFGATTIRGRSQAAATELLHEADMALYQAKKSGRDRVCFFAPGKETSDESFLEPH